MQDERWDRLFQGVLRDVLSQQGHVAGGNTLSVGAGRDTLEILNYKFTLADARDRILWNPVRKFNIYGAIARFLWMLSGSDRLKDIAFYEPRVLGFSDNALTIPGSNYGTRLFMPEPGLDQIKAIIDRIRKDQGTRRAVAAIYRPEDAVRESKDIPCAFGSAFHVREGRLHMTMIMRSNAAWTLLPYNLFEFTLLGELVSVMSGVPIGPYTHIALSMHIYRGGSGGPDEVIPAEAASTCDLESLPSPMLPMPMTTFEDLKSVHKWEADIRYDAKGINVTNFRDYMKRCRDECHPYWAQLCLPLLAYVLFVQKKISAGMSVLEQIDDPLRQALLRNPIVSALNIPGLEEDVILLESRLNLLRYSNDRVVDEARRESLWGAYHRTFMQGLADAASHERRREVAVSAAEWERRDRELGKQSDLFP